MKHYVKMNLATEKARNGCYYRGRTEAFSTKIGLSIGAVTGSFSLRDELTDLTPQFVGNDRQRLKNFGR